MIGRCFTGRGCSSGYVHPFLGKPDQIADQKSTPGLLLYLHLPPGPQHLQKQAIVRKHNPKLTEFIEYLLHSEYPIEKEQEIERIKAWGEFSPAELKQLKEGKSISKPTYDYTQHTRSDVVETITPRDVYILEGLFVLYDEKIRDLCDILVFVDTDADIRFIRRLKRDIEERGRSIDSVCNQYLETVRPMHEQFVEPSKKYAHIIIPEGGNNTVAIDLLITKISSVIDAKE